MTLSGSLDFPDKVKCRSRILAHVPTAGTDAAAVEFVTHASTKNTAGTADATAGAVAAGATMNEAVFNTVSNILPMQKIGVFTTLTDEVIADFETFRSYVDVELSNMIADAENDAVLNGTGVSPQIKGILATTGTLTRAKGTETMIDTLEMAFNDLRTGPAYCEPDALILNPSDWSLIRRLKNTQGNYLLGNPGGGRGERHLGRAGAHDDPDCRG